MPLIHYLCDISHVIDKIKMIVMVTIPMLTTIYTKEITLKIRESTTFPSKIYSCHVSNGKILGKNHQFISYLIKVIESSFYSDIL